MKKLIVFILPLLLLTHNLSASDKDSFLDHLGFMPWPILSLSSGSPEFLAADVGIDLFFLSLGGNGSESSLGTYVQFSPSISSDNSFFRFSTGFAMGIMGLFEFRGGIGYGFMKDGSDFLHTYFYEFAARIIIIQCKIITESPIKPDNLVKYYNNRYNPVKFQIGISI